MPLQVNDNEDGSFLIDYVPTSTGVHSLNCTYGGVKVPNCPISIDVQSPVDLSKVRVDGLETSKRFDRHLWPLGFCRKLQRVINKKNRPIKNWFNRPIGPVVRGNCGKKRPREKGTSTHGPVLLWLRRRSSYGLGLEGGNERAGERLGNKTRQNTYFEKKSRKFPAKNVRFIFKFRRWQQN